MANKHLKHLGSALGFEDDGSAVVGEEGEGLNGSETVEGEMLEVADADAEVSEATTDVDQTEDSVEKLEEIQVALESAAANGGLTRESAVFANIALRAAVGKKAARIIMPAMPSFESYSGGASSRRATTLSVEIVGESLRKFWQALVAKIKQLWNKLRGWWKKMTDAAPKIKARAEALAKKSADVSGSAEERTLSLSLALQLHIAGRTPQPSTAVEQVKKLEKATQGFLGNQTKGEMEKIAREFSDTIKTVEENKDAKNSQAKTLKEFYSNVSVRTSAEAIKTDLSKAAKDHKAGITTLGTSTPSDLKTRFGEDGDHTFSAELMGGRAIVATEATDIFKNSADYTIQRLVRASSIRFTDFLAKPKEIESEGEFKTMSQSDVRQVCDAIADLMDGIIEYNKTWQAREKMQADIEKNGNAAINAAEKDSGNSDDSGGENVALHARAVKDVVGGAMNYMRMGATFESSYINYCSKVSQALLQWAERSLAQYK